MRNELLQQYAKECGFVYRGWNTGRAVMLFSSKLFVRYVLGFPKLASDEGKITIRADFMTLTFENESEAIAHLRVERSAGRFDSDEATASN